VERPRRSAAGGHRAALAIGIALGLAAATAGAQSLEESYANLCSDASAAKSEMCVVLRKALVAKLQAQDSAPAAARAPVAAHSSAPAPAAPAGTPAATAPTAVPSDSAVAPASAATASTVTASDPAPGAAPPAADASLAAGGIPALWSERFGPLARVVDRPMLLQTADATTVTTAHWQAPGEVLVMESDVDVKGARSKVRATMEWDPGIRQIVWSTDGVEGRTFGTVQPDGSLLYATEGLPQYRTTARATDDGALEWLTEQNTNGTWSEVLRQKQVPYTPERMAAAKQQAEQAEAARQAQLAAARAAEEARAREAAARKAAEESSGGWGAKLAGAFGGLMAAVSAGGDASQMVAAATTGAALVSDDADLKATASAMAPMLTGGAPDPTMGALGLMTGGMGSASGSAAGGTSSPGVGGGSFPTKPNLATSACPGFTESNYRQLALSGGGDTQLYTLCGQAFEYYTMYKRAISQGYSEADCNRTYAAHEQSARVAVNFANGG
jgi:hypothetical protein